MWKSIFKSITTVTAKKEHCADPLRAFVAQMCTRIASHAHLADPVAEASYCVVDLETTGLDLERDVIINAAAVKIKKGRITKVYESYIKPPFPVPEESIQWHGLRDEMLVDKPTIGEVLPEFLNFIGDSIITGHHINFDIRMIDRHVREYYDCSIEGTPWLDTMLLHKLVVDNNTSTELDDLMNVYSVDCNARHRALGDAIATAKIFLRILHELTPVYRTVGDMFLAQKGLSRKDNL